MNFGSKKEKRKLAVNEEHTGGGEIAQSGIEVVMQGCKLTTMHPSAVNEQPHNFLFHVNIKLRVYGN